MDNQFTIPGLSEMIEQMTLMQKNSYETVKKSMEEVMAQNNPLGLFCSNTMVDNPLAGACSDFLDILRNSSKSAYEIAEMLVPPFGQKGDDDSYHFITRNLMELPSKIMKKLLEIPPVGITRPYQEKVNQALDKMNLFHAAAMDFVYCSFLPVEEATMITFREMMKHAEALKSPEDMKHVYEKWIKTLEHEYQDMFKTDRYKKVIARIFNSMAEFRSAYRELILDLTHLAGLPGGREVDDLCKDMFAMKKKMKEMERQIKQLTENAEC
jgi:hypothetical protein